MADFLATSVGYYVIKAKRELTSVTGDVPFKRRGHPMHAPFDAFLQHVRSFLDEGQSILKKAREEEEEAVAAVMLECDAELKRLARDMFKHIEEASAALLPLVEGSKPVPRERLESLNDGIRIIESHFGPCSKSDAVPENLLNAEPGSKLYPGLVKKVETVCSRSLAEMESREVERFQAHLWKSGFHQVFDEKRAAIAATMSDGKRKLFEKYAPHLSESDHLPVHDTMSFGKFGSIKISTWNTLEFPAMRSANPVFDGVRPVCDEFLRELDRKGVDCMNLLLEALSSDVVINCHTERILSFVRDVLTAEGSDIVFLQEIGESVKPRIVELCQSKGWSSHFSAKNDDPKKCDAITAIISKQAFDEVAEMEVSRNNKIRTFAAARFSSCWVVSVHLPLSTTGKDKEDLSGSFGSYSFRILQELFQRFGNGNDNTVVIAGGDWNAPIRNTTIKIATSHRPAGCSSLSLYAPDCGTSFHDFLLDEVCSPIDGFFCLR